MSLIKIKKATKTSVEVFSIIDPVGETLECWQYPKEVLFEMDRGVVRMSRAQAKKLAQFILKGNAVEGRRK